MTQFDQLLQSLDLTNDALVKVSGEQLTHKQVQKARLGKPVTPNIQCKILRAMNKLFADRKFMYEDLFAE